jgi:hypothetical protein
VFQWCRRQARLSVGQTLRDVPSEVPARRRGELGGVQPQRPGDVGDHLRRSYYQSVAF